MCRAVINTLLELLELKCIGQDLWCTDGQCQDLVQLVFADDACNGAATLSMLQRIARFWEIWSLITGVKINIAGPGTSVPQSVLDLKVVLDAEDGLKKKLEVESGPPRGNWMEWGDQGTV